ncbi:MAG: TlpA disulfide reductase family protein [Planctomycetota bacterium]
MVFDLITLRRRWALLVAAACCLPVANFSTAIAQAPAATAEEETEDEKPDPFAVPEDATVSELFAFINKVKRQRGDTLTRAKAAIAAAEKIRKTEGVDLKDELKAIQEQMAAYSYVTRADRSTQATFDALLEELQADPREEIKKVAVMELFKSKSNAAMSASEEDQKALIVEWKEMVGDQLDQQGMMLGSMLGRSLGYSKNVELAASFYEDLAALMSVAEDESIRSRAERTLGSARRLRLPGNFMEVKGLTTSGETFDWDAYRGKVVLVDFWASWCGPCRAEVPNMKRNLEGYQSKGFEIVGINLDNTLDACEKYVAQQELTWKNIFSDKDGERGWDAPLVQYYGVSGIPTAILVDQEGKVVSLKARGKELDKLLQEMLGDPVVAEETEEDTEEAEDK